MTVAEWREKSDRLCTHLQSSPLFQQAQTILVYFSVRQEPDLGSLFALPKVWGVSRCVGKDLIWHTWSPADAMPLQKGAYGILAPSPDAPLVQPDAVDLILVPAVACDRRGYRLGYGGGFYDRLLSQPVWQAKPTVGIVFDFASLVTLPHDPWDRPLQAICTESGLFFPEV